jgi:hypothetical protein
MFLLTNRILASSPHQRRRCDGRLPVPRSLHRRPPPHGPLPPTQRRRRVSPPTLHGARVQPPPWSSSLWRSQSSSCLRYASPSYPSATPAPPVTPPSSSAIHRRNWPRQLHCRLLNFSAAARHGASARTRPPWRRRHGWRQRHNPLPHQVPPHTPFSHIAPPSSPPRRSGGVWRMEWAGGPLDGAVQVLLPSSPRVVV